MCDFGFVSKIVMKKILILLFCIVLIIVWFGESRSFFENNGKTVTLWKTYGNTCYIIPGIYYGLVKPSSISYIKAFNISDAADLIWKNGSDTILVQLDKDAEIVNIKSDKTVLINYQIDQLQNDNIYTFFDSTIKVRRYKKDVNIISVSINNMGAL
jgi:hypothetical protein